MFCPVTEDLLDTAMEILNPNTHYNILENGNPVRTAEEAENMFLNGNTESYLVYLENRYIGIIDFLENNPNDNCPWIGLLMIHADYHSKGYGKKVYNLFEEELKKRGFNKVRIGIMTGNTGAKRFWISLGFKFSQIKIGKTRGLA